MNKNDSILYFAQQRIEAFTAKFGAIETQDDYAQRYGCAGSCYNGCRMSCYTTCSGGSNARRRY